MSVDDDGGECTADNDLVEIIIHGHKLALLITTLKTRRSSSLLSSMKIMIFE